MIDSINKELSPIQSAISEYESDLGSVKRIVSEGSERAREIATKTLDEVKEAMSIDY